MKRSSTHTRRGSGRVVIGLAVIAALSIGMIVTFVVHRRSTRDEGLRRVMDGVTPPAAQLGLADPRTVELPPIPDVDASRRWLQSEDGTRVAQFLADSAELAQVDADNVGAAAKTCKAVVGRLTEHGDTGMAAIAEHAATAPTNDVRDVLLNDIAAKGDLLRNCAKAPLTERLGEVRFTHVVAARVLLAIG